jgi:hypothetical protein
MSEQTYTYRNNTLNLDEAYYYTLLLQIDADNFSYAILYKTQLLAYHTNCNLDELTEPKELSDLLSATYRKTIIGLQCVGFTLVPAALFNKEHVTGFARLLNVKEDEKVLAQQLDDDNYIVYKADEQVLAAARKFKLKNTLFAAKGWITAIAQNNPLDSNIYINIDNQAEFSYFKNGKLRFYNAFDFSTAEDLAYYAALVAKEMELLPENTTLLLSGNINADDKTMKVLGEYFFEAILNSIPLLELPAEIASHQILSMAALSLCASSEVL